MTQEDGNSTTRSSRGGGRGPLAVIAMVASSLGVVVPPFGVIGLGLGVLAKRRARARAESRHRLADAAVALGSVTSLLTLGLLAWVIPYSAQTISVVPRETAHASRVTTPPTRGAPFDLGAPWADSTSPPKRSTGVVEHKAGAVTLVDIGPAIATSLTEALMAQQAVAAGRDETVVLWVVMPDCRPCDAVRAALDEGPLQRALDRVRLVRVDVVDFAVELGHLGVPIDVFPGFVLLDADAEAVDYVHGGEWDEDLAGNIAPVLESFIEGTYTERRHPWRGGPRGDETPI